MMTPSPQRYLVAETGVGSGMNVVMSLAAAFVSTGGKLGPPTVASVLMQTFMVVFMGVLVATLLTRMRRRRGRLPSGRGLRLGFSRLAPDNALLRALLAGVVCLLVVAPIVWALSPSLVAPGPGPAEVGFATAAYALFLSVLIIPAALILALNDDLVK